MQAHQFVSALLPPGLAGHKAAIREGLADRGITTGTYFSPHLMQQPYFQNTCVAGALPVCDDVCARIISLPLFDSMTPEEVDHVVACLLILMGEIAPRRRRKPSRSEQPAAVFLRGLGGAEEVAVE